MAFGKNEDPRRSLGFKLVKGVAHNSEFVPFSDSVHNPFEVLGFGDPHTFDMSDEMLIFHIFLTIANFISH